MAQSLAGEAWRRLLKNRMAVMGGLLIVVVGLIAFTADWIASPLLGYRFDQQELSRQNEGPSRDHLCGTDNKGRDLLVRIIYGGKVSLSVGILATLVSLCIGVAYGSVSGYAGGATDNVMMRVVDILYALPFMFFVILLMTLAEDFTIAMNNAIEAAVKAGTGTWIEAFKFKRIYFIFVALGAIQWLTMSRITRGQILSLKQKEFVEAARALGATNRRILTSHLVPNLLGPVIVYTTLTVPAVMLEEAFLSFLGLGIQAPDASWGSLAADGAASINPIRVYWWLVVFPGTALAMTLFSLNFLGDGLRDALDPRLRNR
ncbi:MAG: ABC transporter permease [Acidobacteriota bacterium]